MLWGRRGGGRDGGEKWKGGREGEQKKKGMNKERNWKERERVRKKGSEKGRNEDGRKRGEG